MWFYCRYERSKIGKSETGGLLRDCYAASCLASRGTGAEATPGLNTRQEKTAKAKGARSLIVSGIGRMFPSS